jgi:hypothetical protein
VASFRRSLLGYRRRDVEAALTARDREIQALYQSLTGAQAELTEAVAALQSRQRELGRQAVRIEELDRIATVLAERVVERQRELRVARAELAKLQVDGGSSRAEASRSDRNSRDGSTTGTRPGTSPNGIPSPSLERGGAGMPTAGAGKRPIWDGHSAAVGRLLRNVPSMCSTPRSPTPPPRSIRSALIAQSAAWRSLPSWAVTLRAARQNC